MNAPVTVVMPAYNSAAFIGEALDSVYRQTLAVAEVIVVDDGSQDDTAAIAEAKGATVMRQQNAGVSAARNRAIEAASQPWIAFLDADDVWLPDKIERQWAALALLPDAVMVACDFCQFEGEHIDLPSFLALPNRYERASKVPLAEGIAAFPKPGGDFFRAGNFLFPSVLLARRDALIRVGLFDTSMRHGEDRECFLRVLTQGGLVVVERVLMRYRLHQSNASNDALKMALGNLLIADKIEHLLLSYPEGALTHVQDLRDHHQPVAVRLLMDVGRFAEARALAWRALGQQWRWPIARLLALTWLGRRVFAGLLHAKRWLCRFV